MNGVATVTVKRETLENTVPRAVVFLRGVARNAPIRARLARRGYTQIAHDRGLELVNAVCAYEPPLAQDEDESVRSAMVQLNQLDEDFFGVVEATFRHNYPAVGQRVLGGLSSSTDEGEAFVMMSVLLGRLTELEGSKDAEDQAALALLDSRSEPAERARLGELVRLASRVQAPHQPDEAALRAADDDYLAKLTRLRAWYEEWTGIARSTIKRRDHLIRIGLARPRKRGGDSEGSGGANGSES